MAKPITIPNTFASATSAIPLSQLDQDFSTLANATNDLATYSNYVADTGAADAYIANFPANTNTSSLTAGLTVQFKAANANTGASTLNVQVNGASIGTAAIRYANGSALAAGAIAAGAMVSVMYDGTNFQLINDPAGQSGGDVTGPASATDNAIARFDGASGKLIQNSVVTIADTTGDMSGVGTLSAGNVTVSGTANAATLIVTGNSTLGDASGDTLTITGTTVTTPNGLNFDSDTLVIDAANNNVGIGTSSPDSTLTIYGAGTTSTTPSTSANLGATLSVRDSGGNSGNGGMIMFGAFQGYFAAIKGFINDGGSNTQGNLDFYTRNAATDATLTQRMRITNDGNVGIGTTAALSTTTNRIYFSIKGLGTTAGDGNGILQFQTNSAGSTTPNIGNIEWALPDNSSSSSFRVAFISVGAEGSTANNRGSSMLFATKADGVSGAGTERMRIDSSGNVLVGATALATGFSGFAQIEASGSSGGIVINSTAGNICRLIFTKGNATGNEGLIRYDTSGYSMQFFTDAAERMRITSGGSLLVRTTAGSGNLVLNNTDGQNFGYGFNIQKNGNGNPNYELVVGGDNKLYLGYSASTTPAAIGNFATNGTYTATSDIRKKKDISYTFNGLDIVSQLKPVQGRMLDDKESSPLRPMFIAQDMVDVLPSVVSSIEPSPSTDNPLLGIDYSSIIPILTKAIQEQQAMIVAMQKEIAELKAK